MRARVTFTQMHPDNFPEAVRIYCESTMPAARRSSGNRGALLLTDSATGKSIAVSLWDSPADLAASDSGYYEGELAKFLPLYTVPPVRQEFDVILHE